MEDGLADEGEADAEADADADAGEADAEAEAEGLIDTGEVDVFVEEHVSKAKVKT
jgi:predicted transcriptional regulator